MGHRNTVPARLGAALWLAALCAAAPQSVAACSISEEYRWPTIAERTRAADHVVIGRVARVHWDPGPWLSLLWGRSADIAVDAWLKGNGPALIEVSGFGYGAECRSAIPQGVAILFLAGDAGDGSLAISESGVPEAVIEYRPETAAQIRAAADEQRLPAAAAHGRPRSGTK